jgi:hypothetical protein
MTQSICSRGAWPVWLFCWYWNQCNKVAKQLLHDCGQCSKLTSGRGRTLLANLWSRISQIYRRCDWRQLTAQFRAADSYGKHNKKFDAFKRPGGRCLDQNCAAICVTDVRINSVNCLQSPNHNLIPRNNCSKQHSSTLKNCIGVKDRKRQGEWKSSSLNEVESEKYIKWDTELICVKWFARQGRRDLQWGSDFSGSVQQPHIQGVQVTP